MRPFDLLPRFAAITALVVWGFTLPLLATLGRRLAEPSTLFFVVCLGVASLLILFAQNPNVRRSHLMFWISAGVWTGASYLNQQIVGYSYLLVALLAIASAALREQQRRRFSLLGPVLFMVALAIMIGGSLALARP